jgi:hypothetical protein
VTPQDRQHLQAAHGWFELRAFAECFDELDCIAPAARASREVLELRAKVYEAAGKLAEAEIIRAALKAG